MTDKDTEKILALVDFYSDRAVAHASFFLALLIGLFSVLALAQSNQDNLRWIWAIPYWLLFLGSLYTFANFSLYASYAEKIVQNTCIYEVKEVKDAMETMQKRLILKWHQVLKSNFPFGTSKVIGCLYFIMAFLSCWMVMGCAQAIGGLIVIFVIGAVTWLYVLYRC